MLRNAFLLLIGAAFLSGSFDARGSVPAFTLQSEESFSGVYSLQSLLDFDSLDGASFDPKTGALSLFGHRREDGPPVEVAYLDHLATALDTREPKFSLEWTKESDRNMDKVLAMSASDMRKKIGAWWEKNRLTEVGDWFFRECGVKLPPARLFIGVTIPGG